MPTSNLSVEEHLILFIAALGINYAAAGITARRMRTMLVRGLIERDSAGKYKLTVAGREAFAASQRRVRVSNDGRPCPLSDAPSRGGVTGSAFGVVREGLANLLCN